MTKGKIERVLLAALIGKLSVAISKKIDEIVTGACDVTVGGASWPYIDQSCQRRDYGALAVGNKMVNLWTSESTADLLLRELGFERACNLLISIASQLRLPDVDENEWKPVYNAILYAIGG